MRSFLPFLYNRRGKLESFSVDVKVETRRYKGVLKKNGVEYKATVARLIEVREARKFMITELDSARDDVWGGALEKILLDLDLKPWLNDSKNYRWKEIREVIANYWHSKQKAAIAQQKKEKAKTIWIPSGDYTLWCLARFLTYVFDIKHELLKDESLFSDFRKKRLSDFEKNFTQLVLTPVQDKIEISLIVTSRKPIDCKAKDVIDVLANSKMSFLGPYEDILDPEFEDPASLLSDGEERELKALWKIYEEEKQQIETTRKLSEAERRIKEIEFWESPQGKRLNELNNRRVYGGTLAFEEKESKKRCRAKEISNEIENLLFSWEADYQLINQALDYYQYSFEHGSKKRWEQEKRLREIKDRAKAELGYVKEILKGNWDTNSLTLFGVILGLSASVGFGLVSLVPWYKAIIGFGGAVVSAISLVFLIKCPFLRRKTLTMMDKILR
ncbi:MAG: hypothetical protein ACOZBZ_00265 [Patescibacteria group bacterium]